MPTFGPGVLQIGETGSDIDASCYVNSLRITPSKDEGDSKTYLCGNEKPGKVTYTYAMSGNLDIDSDNPNGLFALSQAEPGSQQPFTFTPDSETETTATGTLVIDPMDFGADEYGDDMNSDIEWTLVGKPEYSYPEAPAPDELFASRFSQRVQDGREAPTTLKPTARTRAKAAEAKGKGKREEVPA